VKRRRALAAGVLLWLAPVLATGPWHWPGRWNPWAPLDIRALPNALTRYKLDRLGGDPQLCRDVLAAAGLDHRPLADSAPAPGCGLRDAVRVARSTFAVGAPFTLSCRAAVSLALWERHAVVPAAARHLRRPVLGLDHLGSYACRDIAGREDAVRSRHAGADAIDVAGFTLEGGQRVTLARDWNRTAGGVGPTPEAAFLRAVRDGACRYFDVVLSPDYNAAHRDHFHLDRGGGRACR
jgi:hypothetical protein